MSDNTKSTEDASARMSNHRHSESHIFAYAFGSRSAYRRSARIALSALTPIHIRILLVSTMATIRRITINPPLINSSCPWASEKEQLQDLFNCPHTGAVTTRTATLLGFPENEEHGVGHF